MDLQFLTDIEFWRRMMDQYAAFGPFVAMGLAALESIFPPLPLFAIVMANVNGFGFLGGALFSWIGTVVGSALVFLFFRWLSKKRMRAYFLRHRRMRQFLQWVKRRGFTPVFLLYAFPFTPSSIVNVVTGLSTLPLVSYFVALIGGKAIMILLMSWAGNDIFAITNHPFRLIAVAAVLFLLWWGGKGVERRYLAREKKTTVSAKE
ncbi:TVP38/TMEM64 family protein [Thermicanus aegyptius]|uniref:TVP38/TMEM64 family protein n=1 Tax=Thermicanus aegyptius TaxID=94009 RepID=UPI00048B659A|nr:TVP38/TMEM64 family protein [Thermicanus aegyptius]